jgi:hypothetical protein
MKVASDYIASIKDLLTAATARDPGNIDITIDKMVSAAATGTDGHAQVVGVTDAAFTPLHG